MAVGVNFAEHGLRIWLSGRFDRAALDLMTRTAWHHPKWDDARYAVVDLRKVDDVDLAEADVLLQAALANAGTLSSRKSRTATVALHPEVRRLTLIFQSRTRAELFEARLFEDLDEAVTWARAAGANDRPRDCA